MSDLRHDLAIGVAKSLADCCGRLSDSEKWRDEAERLLSLWESTTRRQVSAGLVFEELVPFLEHWASERARLKTDFPLRKKGSS